ncbi:MAG: NAD(P)-dependent oxidoreductase [Chloroflexi bacterium]|nr:NAD(P)-dependent oxidoreductase [Chloroflexota bacterium]
MTLLITGADSTLGRALTATLAGTIQVRAISAYDGDLRDPQFVEQVLQGINSVVHLAPFVTRMPNVLDSFDLAARGTHHLAALSAKLGVKRFVLASSLALFRPEDAAQFRVNESFRPRPTTDPDHLCSWLGEVSTRETVRVNGLSTACLRFGEIVDDAAIAAAIAAAAQPSAAWLHVDDAVHAIQRALEIEIKGWYIAHISAGPDALVIPGRAKSEPFNFVASKTLPKGSLTVTPRTFAQIPPIGRPVRNVAILGAGGPLGTAITDELAKSYTLRLCDLKPVEELLETLKPQAPGAPLPTPPAAPHEWRAVDVRDPQQVLAACEGMDAIINVTVIRNDVAGCFQVNMNGAYNVMQAALTHRIHRVVHTGPYQVVSKGAASYEWDYELREDMPPRPGIEWLYLLSKLCGQEIVKIIARQHGFSVPALNFATFVNHEVPYGENINPLSVSWQDSARAIRNALEVESLPTPFELFHIGTDLPHDNFVNEKPKRLLGWKPQHSLDNFYRR